RRTAPYQPRRKLLAAVQVFYPLNAHSRVEQIHGPLSRGVHFPVEPPRDAERDVRSDRVSGLMTRRAAWKNSRSSIGPTPAASCWRMNSSSFPLFKASLSDNSAMFSPLNQELGCIN